MRNYVLIKNIRFCLDWHSKPNGLIGHVTSIVKTMSRIQLMNHMLLPLFNEINTFKYSKLPIIVQKFILYKVKNFL